MALILDKSTTGATSLDSSGNTLTTGYTNLNYMDQYGNVHENPYLIIDNVIIDKSVSFCKIRANIYKDSNARIINRLPIFGESFVIDFGTDYYEQYFSLNIMENINIFKASYDFIKGVYFPNWKSDE